MAHNITMCRCIISPGDWGQDWEHPKMDGVVRFSWWSWLDLHVGPKQTCFSSLHWPLSRPFRLNREYEHLDCSWFRSQHSISFSFPTYHFLLFSLLSCSNITVYYSCSWYLALLLCLCLFESVCLCVCRCVCACANVHMQAHVLVHMSMHVCVCSFPVHSSSMFAIVKRQSENNKSELNFVK